MSTKAPLPNRYVPRRTRCWCSLPPSLYWCAPAFCDRTSSHVLCEATEHVTHALAQRFERSPAISDLRGVPPDESRRRNDRSRQRTNTSRPPRCRSRSRRVHPALPASAPQLRTEGDGAAPLKLPLMASQVLCSWPGRHLASERVGRGRRRRLGGEAARKTTAPGSVHRGS